LYSIESVPKKAFKVVTDFFAGLNVSFKLNSTHIQVEFSHSKKTPAKNILSVLKKLDKTLQKKNKKAILFFDEFQRIAQISESATIEEALRHIAQQSKHIVFIFSGGNRHLLNNMIKRKVYAGKNDRGRKKIG
jgi:AAA+ ATPase superfamily predicted ATPase